MGRDLESVLPEGRRRQHARLQLGRPAHLLGPLGQHCLEPLEAGAVLHLEASASQVVHHEQVQLGGAYRLDVIRVVAVLQSGRAELWVVDPRDHHHRRVRSRSSEIFQERVARLVGQANVEQGDGVLLAFDEGPGSASVQRDVALETSAAEGAGHHLRQGLLVLHDENTLGEFAGGHGHAV